MRNRHTYTRRDLLDLQPEHDTFVGIDSDGCVFDTMEIKQKKCFHTRIISQWRLEPIEPYVRETAEFANLYSKWRGQNRFPCLVKIMDLLRERPEVTASGVILPEFKSLRAFVESGIALGNPSLRRVVDETGDEELAAVLKWSTEVNADVERLVRSVPPFKWARESLAAIRERSDAICVSQTPTEALVREWNENDVHRYVKALAGQELGTKTEHLAMATQGRYAADRILMIGDALGDLQAARGVQGRFYPINPGREAESWERFQREAYARFLAGDYGGAYEDGLIAEFQSLLPEIPPWKRRRPAGRTVGRPPSTVTGEGV